MKFLFLSLLSATFLCVACGSNDTEKPAASTNAPTTATADSPAAAEPASPSANPDYQKGLALVAKSDCLTCHKINEKLIGPSYAEVAAKYPSTPENITRLAHRIIEGVTPEKAVWGTPSVMTPHPQLSQQDAEQMVKYVLLLKK
jgi:cytochrome c